MVKDIRIIIVDDNLETREFVKFASDLMGKTYAINTEKTFTAEHVSKQIVLINENICLSKHLLSDRGVKNDWLDYLNSSNFNQYADYTIFGVYTFDWAERANYLLEVLSTYSNDHASEIMPYYCKLDNLNNLRDKKSKYKEASSVISYLIECNKTLNDSIVNIEMSE